MMLSARMFDNMQIVCISILIYARERLLNKFGGAFLHNPETIPHLFASVKQ